ncbi:MAG: hypothetical protein J0L62_05725, partial [Bacteroidetes bacterium]|nr:hypothetical protein [Bacteroidota bacterium]
MKTIFLLIGSLFYLQSFCFAGDKDKSKLPLKNPTEEFSHFQFIEASKFLLHFQNNGSIVNPISFSAMEYPKNSGLGVLFSSGFAISGFVDGNLNSSAMEPSFRVTDWQPGNISNGIPADPADSIFKVYKYSKNDTPEWNSDLKNWPVNLGAEFRDLNSNGLFEPEEGDYPKSFGDQMLWYVINDGVVSPYQFEGRKPMGLEAQVTVFSQNGKNEALDRTVFVVYKFINKGNKPVEKAIFSVWSDPDIGSADDDLVGVDSVRALGYVYNETNQDLKYQINPPVFGFDLITGPKVTTGNPDDTLTVLDHKYPGHRSLNMRSFIKLVINREDLPIPNSIESLRNYQEGKKFNGTLYDQVIDGIGGTIYDNPFIVHPGFPEQGKGWRDNVGGDKSIMMSTEQFNFMPGDTQIVIVAYLLAQGSSHVEGLGVLRGYSDVIQETARNFSTTNQDAPETGYFSFSFSRADSTPVENVEVNISHTDFMGSKEFNYSSKTGPLFVALGVGDYKAQIISNSDKWGLLADTTVLPFTILPSETLKVNLDLKDRLGYYSTFIPRDSVNWSQNPANPFTSNSGGWRITGNNENPASSIRAQPRITGLYSLVSNPMRTADFENPVLQIWYNCQIRPDYNSITINLLSPDGTIIKQIAQLEDETLSFRGIQFELTELVPFPDSVRVEFVFNRIKSGIGFFEIGSVFIGEATDFPAGWTVFQLSPSDIPVQGFYLNIKKDDKPFVFSKRLFGLNLMPVGNYTVSAFELPSWGVFSSESRETVDFKVDLMIQTDVTIPIIRKYGYYTGFDKVDTLNWITTQLGDLGFPGGIWIQRISGGASDEHQGYLATNTILGNRKGQATLTTAVLNGLHFQNPVLSFWFSGLLRESPGLDTLFFQVSFDDGQTWILLGKETSHVAANGWKFREFKLKDFGSLTDKMIIRFLLNKQSATSCTIYLDEISIFEHTGVSVDDLKNSNGKNKTFTLLPAYPNPFNPSTTIRWIQPFGGEATIRVMNLLGQEVSVISAG